MVYKIIITGANGMLGNALCKAYHERHKVYAFHRDQKCYVPCIDDYSLDLISEKYLKRIFDSINPDLVIHCASLINLDLCEKDKRFAYETNVLVTENIVKACLKNAKLIYISTDQVYGNVNENIESNINLKPINYYGKTKLLGEEKVKKFHTNPIIIRTNIFGCSVKPNRVSSAEWIYNSIKKREKITLFTDYFFSPIYTKYLADIIMQLVNKDFSGIINVGSPKPCSKYEFGTRLANELNIINKYLTKGLINDHNFLTPRSKDLSINTKKLLSLGINAPSYIQSIKSFLNAQNNHFLYNPNF